MASRSARMYDDTPTVGADENGKPSVVRPSNQPEAETDVTGENMTDDGLPTDVRHAHERRHLHSQHEMEHHMHKGGDKAEMHKRHEAALKELHSRHNREMGGKK